MVVGRVWARPLESCGLRAPLFHQAGSSSSGVMVGHRPLWTKRRGLGGKSRRNRVSPKKFLSDKKVGAQSRFGLKHRAMFSTFGSSEHYCEPGIVNTGPYSRVRVDSFVLTKILQKRLNHITRHLSQPDNYS